MFGATVTLKTALSGKTRFFRLWVLTRQTLPGEDLISFSLAKALINKKAGEKITLKRDREEIAYEIVDISYR
ncbi:MAG: GreA/GreB family elongation factor [Marinilabiliales bacterium]|nr:GreA/GreB family elongation factor [Marinilabiliales bacterium]